VQRVGELEGERDSVERGLTPPADERYTLLTTSHIYDPS
jgi:hypothetical protein